MIPRTNQDIFGMCDTKPKLGKIKQKDCIFLIGLMFLKTFGILWMRRRRQHRYSGGGGGDGINLNEQSERKSDGINECFGKMSSKIKFNSWYVLEYVLVAMRL